jgi:FkbM family methyltransferase
MMNALINGWREGAAAAALSDDAASASRLRMDFMASRLLKLGWQAGRDEGRCIQFGGLRVCYRFNRGDLQSLHEVLVLEVYKAELGFSPVTVLDLGANIGLTSLWLHRQHGSAAGQAFHLIAVEAAPENAAITRWNLENNGVPGEVLGAAAGLVSGQAWFETRSESNLGRLVDHAANGAVPVPVVGIRELLRKFPNQRVDLVKMDIEGAEQDLLGHDTGWLESVRALMVEWHDDRADSRPLIEKVVKAGFEHRPLNEARQDNLSLFVKR